MKIEEELQFYALAYGGAAVGRLADGRICFVPGGLPGERALIRLTAEKKRYTTGRIVELLTSSPDRCEAACPLSGICPGCAYMHCRRETELFWKDRQLRDFLVRGGLADESAVLPAFTAGNTLHYRNKLLLHRAADGSYGYYGEDNRTVFPVDRCLLAAEEINELIPQALGDEALFRCTAKDGAVQVSGERELVLHEFLSGAGEFLVDGRVFFQTNPAVASALVAAVKQKVCGASEILELYCGVGVFSIALADEYPGLKTTGIELNRRAIGLAKENARRHQVSERCRFFAEDAGKSLKKWNDRRDLTLLLDPPRGGVEKTTLKKILAVNAGKVIYISCAADTLCRDLKEFAAAGYRVKSSQVFDMFPRTAHFEVLTVLEK
jgi:23S rRNA (uracil1939-C5)-methyltransferase